jgi:xylan 1,4-beta-xylosidase
LNLTRREALGALAGGVLAGMATEVSHDAVAQTPATPTAPSTSFPVTIDIDAAKPVGKLHPIWRFFGADEPNYAYMKDGRKLLAEIGKLAPPAAKAYFRTHNLITTGDGTPALKWGSTNAYTEDAAGKPVYDWTIVDRIFDAYLAAGVRPYVQIGFMPKALSRKPEPYQHDWRPGQRYEKIYTGWAHPPNDYDKWGELVFQWAKHCVEKYGKPECESWYWQTWNEPNIPYWQGTPEEFHRLHDVAIAAVRRALPTARVGGSDTAGPGGNFQRAFLEHCLRGKNYATGQTGTPLDFVSFHAKGQPSFVDGHVRLGIAAQIRNINDGFALVASFPELKDKPIVIGESDPDGCAACQGKQLGYRNGTMYSSYTAATFARKYLLADRHGVNLDGALTWAFEFEDQPFFAGQRVMATNGITLPVFNVFRMMALMGGGQRVAVTSSGEVPLDQVLKDGVRGARPDVSALASTRDGKLFVLAWHYHDDDLPGPDALAEVRLANVPGGDGKRRVTHYRVDHEHANAHTVWQRMGAPQAPTPDQYDQLVAAGQLAPAWPPDDADVTNGTATIRIPLPRQAVALIAIEPV